MSPLSQRKALPTLCFLFLTVLFTPGFMNLLRAQNVTGTISGTVMDATRAVIPGVTVIVRNVGTGIARTIVTGDRGGYSAPLLALGRYEVSAELAGFKTVTVSGIVVQVDETVRVDMTLGVGEISERVTVEAEVALVQSEKSDLGDVIDNKRVDALPLNGRQFVQLVALQAGAGEVKGGGTAGTFGTINGPLLVLNGQLMQNNQYAIDGTTATDRFFNTLSVSPSVEAIQEFKVLTGNYSAEFGGFTGAFVNVTIKSGSNDFHGTAYEFLRSENLDARNFFDRGKPLEFKQNQYGATIGGPVVRNKVFFFFNWEGLRRRKGVTQQYTVPTARMRQGDFSEYSRLLPTFRLPRDPQTGQPFLNDQIPAIRLSPVARELFKYIPLPTLPNSLQFFNARGQKRDDDQINVRGDYQISEKNSLFGRYTWGSIKEVVPALAPEWDLANTSFAGNLSLGYTRILSPNLINEFRYGYNRIRGGQDFALKGFDFSKAAGLKGINPVPDAVGTPSFNFTPFSIAGLPALRSRRANETFQFVDNMLLAMGAHHLKLGLTYYYHSFNPKSDINPRGSYSFNGFYTGLGAPLNSSGLADFLLGIPSTGSIGIGDNKIQARGSDFSTFIQDDWSVTRKLTLNLGLRWEYYAPVGDIRHEQTNAVFRDPDTPWAVVPFDMDPKALAVPMAIPVKTNQEVGLPTELIRRFFKQYAPRFGFAYAPRGDQKTVLRGGFGIYYVDYSLNKPSHMHFVAPIFDSRAEQNQFATKPLTDQELFAEPAAARRSNNIFPLAEDLRAGYTQQWSLGIQRLIFPSTVLEINYVGNKGSHLERNRRPNQAIPGTTPLAQRVRWPFLTNFTMWTTDGVSNYNSMQVRLERSFQAGLAFTAAYTFAKGTDDGLTEFANNQSGSFPPQDSHHLNLEKGLNPSDHNHRFVFNFVYDLPFGSSLTGVAGGFLKNWSFNGIVTYSDGLPLTLTAGVDVSNTISTDRPDRIDNGNLDGSQRTPERWFNTKAFALAAAGRFGNAGRGMPLRGPGVKNVDFSLFKNIHIAERHRLQFRAEFFNLFNHAPLGIPDLVFISPNFGRILDAGDGRDIQFGLKYIF